MWGIQWSLGCIIRDIAGLVAVIWKGCRIVDAFAVLKSADPQVSMDQQLLKWMDLVHLIVLWSVSTAFPLDRHFSLKCSGHSVWQVGDFKRITRKWLYQVSNQRSIFGWWMISWQSEFRVSRLLTLFCSSAILCLTSSSHGADQGIRHAALYCNSVNHKLPEESKHIGYILPA